MIINYMLSHQFGQYKGDGKGRLMGSLSNILSLLMDRIRWETYYHIHLQNGFTWLEKKNINEVLTSRQHKYLIALKCPVKA